MWNTSFGSHANTCSMTSVVWITDKWLLRAGSYNQLFKLVWISLTSPSHPELTHWINQNSYWIDNLTRLLASKLLSSYQHLNANKHKPVATVKRVLYVQFTYYYWICWAEALWVNSTAAEKTAAGVATADLWL